MLNHRERRIIFNLMAFGIAAGILVDVGLAFAVGWNGSFDAKLAATLLNGGVIGTFAALAGRIAYREYLQKDLLPFDRLHQFAAERSDMARLRGDGDVFAARRALVSRTLRLAEETLKGWLPGSHFELCVFVDARQPLLFGYFDSNRDYTARSMAKRETQPSFYVDKGYEVTNLLGEPTSRLRVIPDTHDGKVDYSFTTPEQRKQVRSTLLMCIDLDAPCALVITSDAKEAFSADDVKLVSFVRTVADLVKFDLFDGGFIHRLREMRPDLFPPEEDALKPVVLAPPAPRLAAPSRPDG